jgi:hypothetical protein
MAGSLGHRFWRLLHAALSANVPPLVRQCKDLATKRIKKPTPPQNGQDDLPPI